MVSRQLSSTIESRMSECKLNVAVWSLGSHARRNILPAIEKSEQLALAGIISRNPDRAIYTCFPGIKIYRSEDEALDDPGVQAVYIAGPNAMHYCQARKVLLAGKHAFVEKPVSARPEEVEDLIRIASSAGLVCAETFMFQYHEQFRAVACVLGDTEQHGRVQSASFEYGFPHLDVGDIRYNPELGGGALMDIGVYCISSALGLVDSELHIADAGLFQEDGFSVDTGGYCLLRGKSGVPVFCNWGFGRAYRNRAEIWTTRYSITADRFYAKPESFASRIHLQHSDKEKTVDMEIKPQNHFVQMLEYFLCATEDKGRREGLYQTMLYQSRVVELLKFHYQPAGKASKHD